MLNKLVTILIMTISTLSFASVELIEDKEVKGEEKEKIITHLDTLYSDAKLSFGNVYETQMENFYEVEMNNENLYVSKDGKWMIRGEVFNTEKGVSYTNEQRYIRAKDKLNEFKDTIDYNAENEKLVGYVFTDPTCPYCKKLNESIPILNEYGITIKYIPYPRNGVSIKNEGFILAKKVWCSEDRKSAYKKAENGIPFTSEENIACNQSVYSGFNLGEELNVRGTPLVMLSNGVIVKGFSNAADVIIKAKLVDPKNKEELEKLLSVVTKHSKANFK